MTLDNFKFPMADFLVMILDISTPFGTLSTVLHFYLFQVSWRLNTMVAFWDGAGQSLSLIWALILALSLIFSPELTLAFFLGLFLYICLGLGMLKEAPKVKEHMELNEVEESDKWDAAFPTKVSVESAIKKIENEELIQEDTGILVKDIWGKEPEGQWVAGKAVSGGQ